MKIADITKIIEGTIFVSGEGVDKDEFKRIYDLSDKELNKCLDALKEKYNEDSGINLITYKNKIQLCSNPKYADNIAEILNPIRERSLTKAALETVAIVAYKQPITRTEIEQIRGVNCDYAVQLLQSNNLIEVVGRKDAVGKPLLFGTTEAFLKRFELNSLDELPNYKELLDRIRVIHSEGDSLYREFTIPDENAENSENINNNDIAENVESINNITENFGDSTTAENGENENNQTEAIITNEENIETQTTLDTETTDNATDTNLIVEATETTEVISKNNIKVEDSNKETNNIPTEETITIKTKSTKLNKKMELVESEKLVKDTSKVEDKVEEITSKEVENNINENKFDLDSFEMPTRKGRRKHLIESLQTLSLGDNQEDNTPATEPETQSEQQPEPKLSWKDKLKLRLAEQENQQE